DELAAGLMRAAEKGVRGAADAQTASGRLVEQLTRLPGLDSQRLLGMDVLAGLDPLEAHLNMGPRNGQVHHDFDGRIPKQRGNRHRFHSERIRAGLCRFRTQIRYTPDVQYRKGARSL